MPNPPAFREMYLSFEPGSQLVTTQIMPDGRAIQAVEAYRVEGNTLIINHAPEPGRPGYIINANYFITDGTMTISSPSFSADLQRVTRGPVGPPTAAAPPF